MNTPTRHNPIGALGQDDDDDLTPPPAPVKKPMLPKEEAERIARQQGFAQSPTKEAAQQPVKEQLPSRRRTTGRSEQVNIKTTFAAKKRLMEISVERDMPLGEILEQALEALENSWKQST